MKRCPECRRDYYDDTLLYCLEDGTALVQGSVPSPDEPQTAILHETVQPHEAQTRAQIQADLGAGYAYLGRSKEARNLIKELEERYKNKQAEGEDIGTVYAALGEIDKAFEWIDKDLSERRGTLAEFRWTPNSEPLRDDPRFKDLLKRMGLPD